MPIAIRDVCEHDIDAILALNNSAGPSILPLDRSQLELFYADADYFRVAEVDGVMAGFLIGMMPGSDYQSSNFRWFSERYPAFLYVDRIVVAGSRRGAGLGRVFYADITSFAEVRVPLLTCEVFLEPRNDAALLFHGTYGFQEVGQEVMTETGRRVSLLAKSLPSFEFVRGTWLQNGGLPDVPWLAARMRPGRAECAANGAER